MAYQYKMTELLAHFYHTGDYYHRTQCHFKKCDCLNKLEQFAIVYQMFIPKEKTNGLS